MRVTLAYSYTDEQGKSHAPDTTLDLDEGVAQALLNDGKARTPDTKTAAKKEN
jgi:hypothetical protein